MMLSTTRRLPDAQLAAGIAEGQLGAGAGAARRVVDHVVTEHDDVAAVGAGLARRDIEPKVDDAGNVR